MSFGGQQFERRLLTLQDVSRSDASMGILTASMTRAGYLSPKGLARHDFLLASHLNFALYQKQADSHSLAWANCKFDAPYFVHQLLKWDGMITSSCY